MADLGFLPAVTRILDATPSGGQRMLFSATLDRDVERLVTRYLTEPGAARGGAGHRARRGRRPPGVRAARPGQAGHRGRDRRSGPTAPCSSSAPSTARPGSPSNSPGPGSTAAAIHGNLNQNQRQRALGRVHRRPSPGTGGHRRCRPRPGHRRRRPGRALRPAERSQGLPAPLRPAPPAPARPARWSRWSTRPRSATWPDCTTRPGSLRPAIGCSPATRRSGTSRNRAHRSRHRSGPRPGPRRGWRPRPAAGRRAGPAIAPAGGGDSGRVPRCARLADQLSTGVEEEKAGPAARRDRAYGRLPREGWGGCFLPARAPRATILG